MLRRAWGRRHVADPATLIASHLDAGDPTGWFEPVYAAARRRADVLPWEAEGAHPYLVDWLGHPVHTPRGSRAVVVGCGLGDDVAAVADAGFEVTAFDVAPSAIDWARRRHRRRGVTWHVADVLDGPDERLGTFDLVVEVDTVPWLPGVVRDAAMDGVARLVAPGGVALVVTRLATSEDSPARGEGPPWVQAPSELATYLGSGLLRSALEHPPADERGWLECRLTFQRPRGGRPH